MDSRAGCCDAPFGIRTGVHANHRSIQVAQDAGGRVTASAVAQQLLSVEVERRREIDPGPHIRALGERRAAQEHVDPSFTERGERLVPGERDKIQRASIAQQGGRQGAAEVHFQPVVCPLAIGTCETGPRIADAAAEPAAVKHQFQSFGLWGNRRRPG